jgi:hypothetical protein
VRSPPRWLVGSALATGQRPHPANDRKFPAIVPEEVLAILFAAKSIDAFNPIRSMVPVKRVLLVSAPVSIRINCRRCLGLSRQDR